MKDNGRTTFGAASDEPDNRDNDANIDGIPTRFTPPLR